MASLLLETTSGKGDTFVAQPHCHASEGMLFANSAIEFTALAEIASLTQHHLFALAIELAFKSLALRAGSKLDETEAARHRISKMIALIERKGVTVPEELKRQLNNDKWFKSMLDVRYLTWAPGPFVHSNYLEMIAQILEIKCGCPLSFDGGSAESEIRQKIAQVRQSGKLARTRARILNS